MNRKGCSKKTDQKLDTFDWLCDIPESLAATDLVEVTFKNTRKGYYRNTNNLTLVKGDVVAVESSPGHDIGTVSMTGQLVLAQMKKYHVDQTRTEIKRIYRIARPNDLEKFEEAKAKEHDTMLRARKIAENLKLNMKIGDVEYQGDGNKAIFYYIADERVDFRELIKVLADAFHVRIEMKQIGARQEAGRIGGIGPCGRPLCCSSWMTKFSSVATSSARYQEISLNPQKLAGQCAKLKCCLNFEIDAYVEAQKQLPNREIPLETVDGTFYHFKTDVFSGFMQYSSAKNMASNLVSIPVERVKEIIALNKKGIKVDALLEEDGEEKKKIDYENVVGQDSLTRFDKKKKNKKKNKSAEKTDKVADTQANAEATNAEEPANTEEKPQPAPTAETAEGEKGNAQESQNQGQKPRQQGERNNQNRNNNGDRNRDRRQGNGNKNGERNDNRNENRNGNQNDNRNENRNDNRNRDRRQGGNNANNNANNTPNEGENGNVNENRNRGNRNDNRNNDRRNQNRNRNNNNNNNNGDRNRNKQNNQSQANGNGEGAGKSNDAPQPSSDNAQNVNE
jgi:cell fate regulator YaaT (PSP1 superfamily)